MSLGVDIGGDVGRVICGEERVCGESGIDRHFSQHLDFEQSGQVRSTDSWRDRIEGSKLASSQSKRYVGSEAVSHMTFSDLIGTGTEIAGVSAELRSNAVLVLQTSLVFP